MCGIAAVFAYDPGAPPVCEAALVRVRDSMQSRGPDGSGLWIGCDGRVGLAHRRLSIIDLSDAGLQPMSTRDGRLNIVFNGEIYNYRELKGRLEAKGYVFESQSDTEVILHLYADRGPEMLGDLRGMFAFALWDAEKRGLLLARDPFGIKPLYYADNGRTIWVASQVKALLAGGAVNTEPEPAGHTGFFLWGHVPEPYTLYKGIRALPAGNSLWIDARGCRGTRSFFKIREEFCRAQAKGAGQTSDVMRTQLADGVGDSVRHHMIADVPVGVFLSSGIDSTVLAATASAQSGSEQLRTITLGFREYAGTPRDEAPLAERIAQSLHCSHQTKWITAADFEASGEALFTAMDQPTIDGVNTYFVSKVAASTGLKVALSGIGADELLAGYNSFQRIPFSVNKLAGIGRLPWLGTSWRVISAPVLKHFTSPKYSGVLEYGGTYSGAYLLNKSLFMPWELPRLLDRALVREGWRELETLSRLDETIAGISGDAARVSALELSWYMRNQLLRDADWAGMAHSLEIRVPYVDPYLFRTISALSATANPPRKRDLFLSAARPLPPEMLDRKKSGFNVPVQNWLMNAGRPQPLTGGLRQWAEMVYRAQWKG